MIVNYQTEEAKHVNMKKSFISCFLHACKQRVFLRNLDILTCSLRYTFICMVKSMPGQLEFQELRPTYVLTQEIYFLN